jgi:outer membrane protein assembly factor BamA
MRYLKKYFFLVIVLANVILADNSDSVKTATHKFIVDSIKIYGNDITEDFVILRELTFQIEDSVSQEILHFNRERVYSLGLFNRVEISNDSSGSKNKIIIDINESWYVYPIPFWYIMNGDTKKSTYGINFTFKNFRGRNQTLRASLGLGYDSFFSISFDNPTLVFEDGIGINFSLSYNKYMNRNLEAERLVGNSFDYKVFSAYFGLYKRIDQFNLAGFNVGFSYREALTTPLFGVTASLSKIDRYPSATLFYYYDTRDLKLFSDYGFYGSTVLSHKGFGINNISYNVLDIDIRQYFGLIESLTAKCRFNVRHTFGNIIPYYDYSFLGYMEKIRGHYMDYLEGHNSILISLELSQPVIREWNVSLKLPLIPQSLTSARIGIYINSFFDTGTTFNNGNKLLINKFYSGYGFGLTFLVLPYNAFRIEYAFNEFGKGEFIFATGFSF